ncbi:MAG: hypothetical protein U5L96_03430 [Owenweeksia sp.]|nr:hypothetical protein [Owenweeksia sp.]
MKQQSETIATSGFTITTPPTFPLQPKQSKQLLLVLLAAVIGFVVPLTMVLLVEFLDNTVKSPIRAEDQTGLKILGAYPNLNVKSHYKNVDMDWLTDKSIGLIVQTRRLGIRKMNQEHHKPTSVLIFSTRENEGKSFIADSIARELATIHKKVLVVSPDEVEEVEGVDSFTFSEQNTEFLELKDFQSLLPDKYRDQTMIIFSVRI